MSYQVSARKWRPQSFSEVVGQGHIIQTLKNAILNKRIGHAYLFSGPRGVGKTTMARIFAKALNCIKGPAPEPCNECEMCREITGGFCTDVVEIDGASNTGVDNVRELRENVKYASSKGKYRVYIVDEVHMLSKAAFNAFLKTLEEPPPHIIFIFATTEPNKIPETIISRCQYFEFKKISIEEVVEQLTRVVKREGIEISGEMLTIIAKSAEGSMRDALVSLDQIISFSGNIIKEEDVKIVLGFVGREVISTLLGSIIKKDIHQILELIKKLNANGTDFRIFCKEFLEYVRNLIIVKAVTEPEGLINLPAAEIRHLGSEAEKMSIEELQQIFNSILKIEGELKYSSQPTLVLEMALIRMTQMGRILAIDEILKKLDSLAKTGYGIKNQDNFQSSATISVSNVQPKTEDSETANDAIKLWERIKEGVSAKKPSLGGILEDMKLSAIKGDEVVLGFSENASESFYTQAVFSNEDIIKDAVREILGKNLRITIETSSRGESPKKRAVINGDIEKWKKEKTQEILDIIPGVVSREI